MATITGDAAGNTLTGTPDPDTLLGLGGDDILIGNAGGDVLDGGAGSDFASYSTSALGVTASLADPSVNTGDAAGDSYISVENLIWERSKRRPDRRRAAELHSWWARGRCP
jgi:Ca2+-binding RTX toxin-like protein